MTNLLYELSFVLTMATGLFSLFSAEIAGEDPGLVLVLITILTAGVFVLIKKMRWTGRLILISILVALGIAGFFLSRNDAVLTFFSEHKGYLWTPVIGAAAFLVGELISVSRLLRIIVSLAAIGWLIAGTAFEMTIEKLFVVSVVFLILLTLTEEIQRRWKKQGDSDQKKHVVFLLPYLLLAVILVFASPAPEDPYDWGLAKKVYEVMTDLYEILEDQLTADFLSMAPVDPSEAMVGFSEEGKIAGKLYGGDREMLVITGLSSYVDQVRLSGKTFSAFDGREWVDRDTSEAPAVLLDTISTWASLNHYSHHVYDYAHKMYIDIKYQKLRTDRAFLPMKSIPTYAGMKTEEYRECGGDILWPEVPSRNSVYSLSYYTLNMDHGVFDNYLNRAEIPDQESYEAAERRINYDKVAGCGYQDYLRYVEHVKKNYLEKPELSPKLRKYMDDVYGDAETDSEKMKRLEEMLRGFTYTEEPGVLPDRIRNASDFLDYFVLESRKGFCSHFATAFVLLARAEGIPARYAQGFLTHTGGRTGITVKSKDAHAWPEVYYEGAGWIPYEPTPAYDTTDSFWKTEKERKEQHTYGPDDTESEKDQPEEEQKSKLHIPIRWYMIVIPLAVGLVCILLVLLISKLISAARFRGMGEEEKLVALYRQNLRILRMTGLGMMKNETLDEYRNRLREKGVEETVFLEEMEKYLYRGLPSGDAVSISLEEKKSLLLALKKKSRLKYIRYRILP